MYVITLNVRLYAADDYRRVLATTFAHFQHGGHEPEVVISRYLQPLAGPCKSHLIIFAHDKSDGMYAGSVRQVVMHKADDDDGSNRK